MKFARIRLILAAVAMIGWLGYLGYLALGQSKPVVVSRTQLLHATHFVKADVTVDGASQPATQVTVSQSFGVNHVADGPIEIVNIADARLPGDKPLPAGSYFLPLINVGPKQFRVVSSIGADSKTRLTVYPWSPEVEHQVRDLIP